MLTHGGIEAEKVITAQERQFQIWVSVDWNHDGQYSHVLSDMSDFVLSVGTDRQLHGQAPTEIMLIEGAAAGELSLTVGGEHKGLPMSAIFAPFNGNSPMYNTEPIGAEIRYEIGVETVLGTVWYPQFVGNVRTIEPSRADGTVVITALDFAEKLRVPVSFPAWAISDWWVSRDRTAAQLCDPQWIIRNCLLRGYVGATNTQPAYGANFFWSGGGSYAPEVGKIDNPWVTTFPPDSLPMYEASGLPHSDAPDTSRKPLVLRASNGVLTENRYWVANQTAMPMNSYHFLGFTLNLKGTDAAVWKTIAEHDVLSVHLDDFRQVIIRVGAGRVRVELREQDIYNPGNPSTSGPSLFSSYVTINPGPNDQAIPIYAIVDTWDGGGGLWPSTGTRAYIQAGTASTGGWSAMGAAPVNKGRVDRLNGLVQVYHKVSVSDVFYSSGLFNVPDLDTPTLDVASEASRNAALSMIVTKPVYGASLDRGLNRLSYFPYRTGEDAWEVIKDVAAADFGAVFWDEDGLFNFWNQQTIQSKRDTVVRTLTLDDVAGLNMTNSLDSVRNVYSVQTKKKKAVSATVVWESNDPDEFYIPAQSGKNFIVGANDAQMCEPWALVPYLDKTTASNGATMGKWSDSVAHGFVHCLLNSDGKWEEPYYDDNNRWVQVSAQPWGQGQLLIGIYNRRPVPIRFTNQDGTARFRVQGTRIDDGAEQVYRWQNNDATSYQRFGTRNLPLSGDWYQEHFNDAGILDIVGPRTGVPIPTTDAITVVGDPRIQLGDCIDIADPEGMGERMKFQILGIRREWSLDSGLTDTLTVELIRPAGVGIWDSPQYGRWDETFTWS